MIDSYCARREIATLGHAGVRCCAEILATCVDDLHGRAAA